MKREFPLLWRWCLVLAVLVNTIAPVWAGAAMDVDLLQRVGQRTMAIAGDEATTSAASGKAGCESDTRAPRTDTRSDHSGCDCGSAGTCTCPCAYSVKLIDIRVEFAARHLLSVLPAMAVWESADTGPRTSVFRPPIA